MRAPALVAAAALLVPSAAAARDWPRFGFDAARSDSGPAATGIAAADLGRLRHVAVALDGTVDSSPIYLAGVDAGGAIRELAVSDGAEVRSGEWPATITPDPAHENLGTALNLSGASVLVTTGGYLGDAPPYQGHVVALDRVDGHVRGIFNALCSDTRAVLTPSACPDSGSAIWARAGAVVVPRTRTLLVATGNARFDGRTAWGDSVLELAPDARALRQSFTPTNQAELAAGDVDLGSTSPAVLPGRRRLALQSGKEGVMYLLDLDRLNGRTRRAGPRRGGQLQRLDAPGRSSVFTTPAVWRRGGRTWVFVASTSATAGYMLGRGRTPRLRRRWLRNTPATSPVVAGGLLWAYDADDGSLNVYDPVRGRRVGALPAEPGHWNSPIVLDGRIALPVGDGNAHERSGTLHLWSLP
jgi:hypothetical protein